MLTFFRKYQKIIFIFTTVMIIASFSFFGTMGSMGGAPAVEEKLLVKAIDGSSISFQKVDRMALFLGSSLLDLKDDRISHVNVLNDGVLEKDFLETSLGQELAEKIFPDMQNEIDSVLEKASSFHSYRHAFAPFISAESAWAQFSPESSKLASELLMRSQAANLRQFDLLCKSYLAQQTVPSRFIKKVLAYQEEQSSKGKPDPALAYADVSLLGLHSAKEWLGSTYIRGVSQVILNASALAKRQGFKVSPQEAREELIANLKEAIQMTGSEIDQSLYQTFLLQVRRLGMTEVECLDLWKDIALFRKVFASSTARIEVNPEQLEGLQKMAKKQAVIETFSLPTSLQIKDFSSLMKLQLYVDAVSKEKVTSFILPTEFSSLSEIEKKAPDLVQKEYCLEYAEVDVKKVASQISLKETWAWQTEEFGWSLLKKKFPTISKADSKTKEERFTFLEGLNGKERLEIDRFSREQILTSDLSKVKKILLASPMETRSISLSAQGTELTFKGIQNPKALMAFLETVSLKGESTQDPAALMALEKLSFYTDDNEHYYFISVVERSPVKKVLTFEEANQSGTLRRMLERKLELAYSEIRKKDSLPYLQKDGSWKPLSEVKDKIGLVAFASRLKTVNAEYSRLYGKEPSSEQKESPDFYVQNWMLSHMKQALTLAKAGSLEKKEGDLERQWNLVQEKKTADKADQSFFKTADSFEMPDGEWSSVVSLTSGRACFFKMLEKLKAVPSAQEIEALKAPLKEEARKQLFSQLFQEIELKKAISLKDPA